MLVKYSDCFFSLIDNVDFISSKPYTYHPMLSRACARLRALLALNSLRQILFPLIFSWCGIYRGRLRAYNP